MSKLREQFLVNDRLRQYIERMLSIILENSPQLLEITLNGDIPIGSYTSTTHRNESLIISTNENENTSIISPPPSEEPLKSSTKQSNDKYCRL